VRRSAWITGCWLVASLHAHAQDALPLELHWRAPPECPSAAHVRAEPERIARARPGFALTPLRASAEVEKRGATYALELHTEHAGERGERQLDAADCSTLVRTLTLVLALAYGAGVELANESGNAPPQGPEPAPNATPPLAAGATQSQAVDRANSPEIRGHQLDTKLWVAGGVTLGLLPSAALSLSAGVELARGAWSVAVGIEAWPTLSDSLYANLHARFDALGGQLRGCRTLPVSTLELGLCATLRAAAMRGRSLGATADGSATAPWYALGGSAGLSWPRGSWLVLRIEAGVAASLDRPQFVIDGVGTVQRVAAWVGALDALALVTL
jgi:hypothetical protein